MANIIEDVVSRPEAAMIMRNMIEDARERDERKKVSMDGTYKITMSVLGQRRHGAA